MVLATLSGQQRPWHIGGFPLRGDPMAGGAADAVGQDRAADCARMQLNDLPDLALHHLQGLRVPLLLAEPRQVPLRTGCLPEVRTCLAARRCLLLCRPRQCEHTYW